MAYNRIYDNAQWYMDELASKVVAESGRADDRFHLGKLILRVFKDYPEHIQQIDGITGESVTNRDVMERSIKCATCFRNMGLNVGDVIIIMSASNLDISVPLYAALFSGVIVAPVDRTLGILELVNTFELVQPKAIFCQSDRESDIKSALNKVDLNSSVVTFDKKDNLCSLDDFFDQFGSASPVENFQVTNIDCPDATAFLVFTSGTTGLPKAAEITHKNFASSVYHAWSYYLNFPSPFKMTMVGGSLHWMTGLYINLSTSIFVITRLESSSLTLEIACKLINTYKPQTTFLNPMFLRYLMKVSDQCDLSCFKQIHLGGSAVPSDIIDKFKEQTPGTTLHIAYGITEVSGLAFLGYTSEQGNRIMRLGCYQYRLVDHETNEDVLQPHVRGELWLKGPTVFKGYYKNEMATKDAFSEDGWFKTGDMFYRDEYWNYFFVERIKLLLKYKSYQITPLEVENVIRGHPGVMDVAVTGIPDNECGDLPVACVVRRPGYDNISEEIKTLVKETLSDAKQLRGGVLFVDAIPLTSTTKVNRNKLKELVKNMKIQ